MNLQADIKADGPRRHADAIREFIRSTRGEIPKILRTEGRLTAQPAMRFTPAQKGKRAGEWAVERDINRAIRPILPQQFRSPRLRRLAEAKDYVKINRVLAYIRGIPVKIPGGDTVVIRRVTAFAPERHTRVRDNRGRVQRNRGLGTFDLAEQQAYVDRVKTRVGLAKSGWAQAIVGLAAKTGQRGAVPAYIARHSGSGQLEDRADNPAAYIRMKNISPWARYKDEGDRVVTNAMNSRGRALEFRMHKAASDALQKSIGKLSKASNATG